MANAADTAIAYARAQIGKPYQWGATGPDKFDCSGLIYAAYKSAGISLGRTTYQQIFNGREVAKADLAPGDLVFPDPGHVQIYVGGGKVVESPHAGATVREVAMWGFWRARRVTDPGTGSAGGNSEPIAQPIANPVSEIVDMVKTMFAVFEWADKTSKWLSEPRNLLRVAAGVAGVILVLAALVKLGGSQLSGSQLDSIASIAGKVIKK